MKDILGYYREARKLGRSPLRCRAYAIDSYARRHNVTRAEARRVLGNILRGEVLGINNT